MSFKVKIFCLTFIFVSFVFSSYSNNNAIGSDSLDTVISISEFLDSSHHWYDIFDEVRTINPLPNQKRYQHSEVKKIADNIVLFQKNNGGWPKNYDMLAILTNEQHEKVLNSKNDQNTTFDNGATHSHVEYLAKAYSLTKDRIYKNACLKGIDFILSAQYKNGGWPQFYPIRTGYHRYITFNDGAMIGIMKVLKNISEEKSHYSFVDRSRRKKVAIAYEKGVKCILNCQIKENNELTVWCQQHDEKNFQPRKARTYELASKCSQESAEIVLFLMECNLQSEEKINSIQSAVRWFEKSRLFGLKYIKVNAQEEKFIYHNANYDRIIVEDIEVPPIWARFYELNTNKPLFANRDGISVYSHKEVEKERRTGYMWYNYAPQKVLDMFADWKKTYKKNIK